MKKFTAILLWAALALPMVAQNPALDTRKGQANIDRNNRDVEQVTVKPLNLFDGTLKSPIAPKADLLTVFECGFETDEEITQWSILDNDGDGNGWRIDNYYAHTGNQSVTSDSYYGGALSPDNFLISPTLPLGGTFSLWAMNYSGSYPDKVGVFVCVGTPTSAADFVQVGADITPPTTWTQYEFDLSAYAGQEGCIAIRHYGVTDMFRILIDDVALSAPGAVLPQNLTVVPAATTADVAWEDQDNVAWNLRYRQVNPKPEFYWDFEQDTNGNQNTDLTDGWTSIDADGDGSMWYHLYGSNFNNHSGNGHVTSASYQGAALTPDNWLVSPKVKLESTLSFWAAGQDASYAAEVFAVYASVGDPTDVSSFVKISDDITATGTMTEYKFDLSSYGGQEGYVAIRHYNVTDMFRLNVDDIMIGEWAGETEWIYVNDLNTTNYTITGLTPETMYEVQVQGIDAEGTTSAWTESTQFTTLAEGQQPTETKYYVTGGFNGWNAETPEEIGAAGVDITAVADPADEFCLDFKLLTPGENDWIWIGGINENAEQGINYFAITDEMMTTATEIDLYPGEEGWNFRLPAAGTYNISLLKEPIKDPIAGVKMVVTKKTITGVNDINAKAVAGVKYYNLAGVESNVPFDGVNVVVTTYTDGTKAASKVIK